MIDVHFSPVSMRTSISILFAPGFSVRAHSLVFFLPHVGKLGSSDCVVFLRGSLLAVGVPEVKEQGMESQGLLVPHSKFDSMPFMEQ